MNLTRTLVTLSTVGVMTGCAIAPSPSPEDNPYYTTKSLKPYVVADSGVSSSAEPTGVVTSPVAVQPSIEVRPLPQTVIFPGKTLPAAPVAIQPAAGIDINNLNRFDSNKDGIVTTQEILSDGLSRMMAFDRNNDGYLNQSEFLQAMGDRRNRFGASTNLFKHLDANRDNKLSSQELANYLAPSINALDATGNGVISSLSPIPPFPEAERAPPPSTTVAGLPRIVKPGAAGTPVRASSAKATKKSSVKKGSRHVVKGKKVTPPKNTRKAAKPKASQKKKTAKKSSSSTKKNVVSPKKKSAIQSTNNKKN